jgi:hypothetical protein
MRRRRLAFNVDSFDVVLEIVLRDIKERIAELDERTASYVGQLAYLKHLSSLGALDELTYKENLEPDSLPDDKGDFYCSLNEGELRISASFKNAWLRMQTHLKLERTECLNAMEHFLLHEIFHFGQNLTGERHRDSRRAQRTRNCIDYHADASAVFTATLLSAEYDAQFDYLKDWRRTFASAAHAARSHIYAFNFAENSPISFTTFIRHFTWHYHSHRIVAYRRNAHYQELQLLFEPGISLRGMQITDWYPDNTPPKVTKDWVRDEPPRLSRNTDQLFLAVPNWWGVAGMYRFGVDTEIYRYLIEGVLDGDLGKTKPFFRALFDEHKILVGRETEAPKRTPPTPPRLGTPPGQNVQLDDELAPKLMRLAAQHAADKVTRYVPAAAHLVTELETPAPPLRAVRLGE